MDDFRKRSCPACGKVGVYLDPTSQELRCKYCKLAGLRFDPPLATLPKEVVVPKQGNTPPVPPNVPTATLVNEFYVDEHGTRHNVATYYLPRETAIKVEEFDSESPWAKIAKIRFRAHAKRRRLLNHAIITRGRRRGQELGPWSEGWTAEERELSTLDIDGILRKVVNNVRRRTKNT